MMQKSIREYTEAVRERYRWLCRSAVAPVAYTGRASGGGGHSPPYVYARLAYSECLLLRRLPIISSTMPGGSPDSAMR